MIEHLTRNVTSAHISEIFGPYGTIRNLHAPLNHLTGMIRGFAFVEYAEEAEAQLAQECMHGGQIDGAVVAVQVCESRPPRKSGQEVRENR